MSYPEHDKLIALRDRADEVQGFIDWLCDDQDVVFAAYGKPYWNDGDRNDLKNEGTLYPVDEAQIPAAMQFRGRGIRERLMAAYFEIDLDKISDEKDQMYNELVAANG
jgi:hypothetical protein